MPARDMTRWTRTETGSWKYTPNKIMETEDVAELDAEPEVPTEEPVVEEEPSPEVSNGFEDMTLVQLREELIARGLPKSGNKDELIVRLTEADNA